MLKDDIDYYKQWIKTDLQNTRDAYLQGQIQYVQWMVALNQGLDRFYLISLITEKSEFCEVIRKYREQQNKIEEQLVQPQEQMLKNAENIFENIMKVL